MGDRAEGTGAATWSDGKKLLVVRHESVETWGGVMRFGDVKQWELRLVQIQIAVTCSREAWHGTHVGSQCRGVRRNIWGFVVVLAKVILAMGLECYSEALDGTVALYGAAGWNRFRLTLGSDHSVFVVWVLIV